MPAPVNFSLTANPTWESQYKIMQQDKERRQKVLKEQKLDKELYSQFGFHLNMLKQIDFYTDDGLNHYVHRLTGEKYSYGMDMDEDDVILPDRWFRDQDIAHKN